jgi:hypothetical protein
MRRSLLLAALLGAALVAPAGAHAAASPVWLCKPGVAPDPCTPGLATTRFSPAGARLGVEHPKAVRDPKIDCFYVYPTVSDQKTTQANLHIDPQERSIALYQAARYSQECRVYAPMYRQYTLAAITNKTIRTTGDSTAYRDVRDAWRSYLKHDNKGRGVVLIGHSQGSFMLRQLVTKEIDPSRRERALLVSALLLGGNVTVKAGRDVGGDFQHVPACRSTTQLGCVVAFSTYNATPPANSLFGRTAVAGREVLCTNPTSLKGGSGLADAIFPSAPFAPGSAIAIGIALLKVTLPTASTTWISSPGSYRARCSAAGGAHTLQVTPVGGAPVFTPSPDPTWGLHLVDANIALGNLVSLVGSQAAAYAKRAG